MSRASQTQDTDAQREEEIQYGASDMTKEELEDKYVAVHAW